MDNGELASRWVEVCWWLLKTSLLLVTCFGKKVSFIGEDLSNTLSVSKLM